MRFTRLVSKTLRDDPPEAETASHRLMLRAGMIHQVAAGVYSYLPLAWRSLRKIENIIREEMDAAGGQELMMPSLQPVELWEHTGRKAAFGDSLFSLEDRRGRPMVLAPTHEEVVTGIVKAHVQSYRDLPLILYQIQTKFRDEPRPRAGLVRVREFDMKDAYSFNADDDSLDDSYQAMAQAYRNIYRRSGLPVLMVEADSGAIGGKNSHEFILPATSGEDTVIICSGCSYAANAEKAAASYVELPAEPEQPLEEVSTPGVKTIAGLAQFLGVPEEKTFKAVFYMADDELAFVTIRGDLEVNEIKLKNVLHCSQLRLAGDEEVKAAGLVAGSASAIGLNGVRRVADPSITQGSNFVVGANKPDTHLRGANYPRDFQVDILADIALAQPGQLCLECGRKLESTRGIEVGHIFKLGTFFSDSMGAQYLDRDGRQQPMTMGCYGIGVGRLLAAAIEQNHDERGIVFPAPLAPYQVHLVGLNLAQEDVAGAADSLYQELWEQGFETLYDDRPDQAAGVKLNDADLMGLPVRLVVSPRNLKNGVVELKGRQETEAVTVAADQVVATLRQWLNSH
ncbi:MAG: proline--tRNA ligase [Dehalococcoidia bacterium]|jgi:prolyl-tRNA synthetase|nr:proline--tRNA ligase [Dehalococcoidia bacterium]MDP6226172.1 proline--tRNA ligase [Dehalococcoidia bacterium]MDP7085179.1 proline--tRNA ligase [Dehalococcoidia bacterium]MDP7200952.1 proline--tRNA ligase [Dehalococcoidia bacterium]MDP7509571.1 proline--tRNA ligase [Dehalococcoidia bacterium]